MARRANIELKISCLLLLWPGLKWFCMLDYYFYWAAAEPLEDARATLGFCGTPVENHWYRVKDNFPCESTKQSAQASDIGLDLVTDVTSMTSTRPSHSQWQLVVTSAQLQQPHTAWRTAAVSDASAVTMVTIIARRWLADRLGPNAMLSRP